MMFSKFVASFKNKVATPTTDSAPSRATRKANQIADTVTSIDLNLPCRNVYSRPCFLQISQEEEDVLCNQHTRPIVVPKDVNSLPLGAGYAECINGGKSKRNEDEAAAASFVLPIQRNGFVDCKKEVDGHAAQEDRIEIQYFGIFDGHAGIGASLMAADQLINHLQSKLVQIQSDLVRLRSQETCASCKDPGLPTAITIDSLVTGAIEAAFVSFDEEIATERHSFNISGGCAAVVALVLLERVYVANAGDCRAVIYCGNETVEIASEFTPESDGQRIQQLAHMNPHLTHSIFSDNYFLKHLGNKDVGTRVLCRGPLRSGWYYKEVTDEDVSKPPLVAGHGKGARLMGMIGVTRGFGDYDLVIPNTRIHVKPFLTPIPEVRVFNLAGRTVTADDILVMGCDGLWDMLKNEQVGATARSCLAKFKEGTSLNRYTKVAEELVLLARGDITVKGWRMKDGQSGSFDDITAFVIPLHRCLKIAPDA